MTQDERNTLIFRIAGLALVFMGLGPLVRQGHMLALALNVGLGSSGRYTSGVFAPVLATGMHGLFGLAMVVTSRQTGRLLLGRGRHRVRSWHEEALGVGVVLMGCYLLAFTALGLTAVLAAVETLGFLVPAVCLLGVAGLALAAAGRRVGRLLAWQGPRSEERHHPTTAQALSTGLSLLGVLYGARYGAVAAVACWSTRQWVVAGTAALAAIGLPMAAGAVLAAGRLGRGLARSAPDVAGPAQRLARMPAEGWVLVTLEAGLLYLLLQALPVPWGSVAGGWLGRAANAWPVAYAELAVLAVLLALAGRLLAPAVVRTIWRGGRSTASASGRVPVPALEAAMTVLLLACIVRLLADIPATWSAMAPVYRTVGAVVIALVLLGFRADLAATFVGSDAGRDRSEDREERRALLHVCLILLGVALTLGRTAQAITRAVLPPGVRILWLPPDPFTSPVRLLPQAALGPVLVLAARPLSRLLAHGPLLPLILAGRRPQS
jgi:hypothetical protein